MTGSSAQKPESVFKGLNKLDKNRDGGGCLPPVESWNPPSLGDIGMEIRKDGRWFYQNGPIERPAMVKLFSRILRRDPDGSYWLVTPVEKCPVQVEDAPFAAVLMDVQIHGEMQVIRFETNAGDIVTVDREHPLRFVQDPSSGALKPYVRIRGRLDALVVRGLLYDLAEIGCCKMHDGSQWFGVWSSGIFWPMGKAGETDVETA